jgi:hypothetical protein
LSSAPTSSYLAIAGSVLVSGSATDWESKGLRNSLRKALATGLGVPIAQTNITSSVAGSALVSFVIFQDASYKDPVSIRNKLLRSATVQSITKLIKAETGVDVLAGPYATREVRVDKRGGATIVRTTWFSLNPSQLAGTIAAVLAVCACCGAACAYSYCKRRAARGQQRPTEAVPGGGGQLPIVGAPAPVQARVRGGADKFSLQSYMTLPSFMQASSTVSATSRV